MNQIDANYLLEKRDRNLSRSTFVSDFSTNPKVTFLGAKQRAPQSRRIGRELEASAKQRAEPEAEDIAIAESETKNQKTI